MRRLIMSAWGLGLVSDSLSEEIDGSSVASEGFIWPAGTGGLA